MSLFQFPMTETKYIQEFGVYRRFSLYILLLSEIISSIVLCRAYNIPDDVHIKENNISWTTDKWMILVYVINVLWYSCY